MVDIVSSGELFSAISFMIRFPTSVWFVAMFSVCSALGQICVYKTITGFGSLMVSTVTTTRYFTTLINLISLESLCLLFCRLSGLATE